MTAEEWTKGQVWDGPDKTLLMAHRDGPDVNNGHGYLDIIECDTSTEEHDEPSVMVPPHARKALAALCLHEQPFGFTREMENIVRWAAEIASAMSREPHKDADPERWKRNCHDHMVLLREVADLIEALLPPETEE